MMADKVLGKINLSKSLERESISVFPNSLKFQKAASSSSSSSSSSSLRLFQSNDFRGHRLVLHNHRDETGISPSQSSSTISLGRVVVGKGKGQRWWEKGVEAAANMKEVRSAQELVDSMRAAGDALVVLDFFSPSCGGCKALHPKICQFAEMNPDVQFLQVNYEEHKSMCYSLNVHVLPLFRFYRGPHGRLCSFSCTNATIKKFRDALAKYNPERLSLGVGVGGGPAPAKGLEEKELIALAANKDLSFTYTPTPTSPSPDEVEVEVEVVPNPVFQPSEDKTLITSDR